MTKWEAAVDIGKKKKVYMYKYLYICTSYIHVYIHIYIVNQKSLSPIECQQEPPIWGSMRGETLFM